MSTHVINIIFSHESGHEEFVLIHEPIGQGVKIAFQNIFNDMTDDVPELWEPKNGFPSFQAYLTEQTCYTAMTKFNLPLID